MMRFHLIFFLVLHCQSILLDKRNELNTKKKLQMATHITTAYTSDVLSFVIINAYINITNMISFFILKHWNVVNFGANVDNVWNNATVFCLEKNLIDLV